MHGNEIYLIGEVGVEITLQNVIDAVKKTNQSEKLTVNIHSNGGSIYEGRAIYNYLKSLPQEVETVAIGMVASIATIIMLAGNKGSRFAYAQNNVLIHMPSVEAWGYADDLKEAVKVLEDEEVKIANIYADETNFTYSEVIELMKQDRMMNYEEIQKFGLEIKEYKAVAKYENFTNKNENKMNKKTETLLNKVAKFLGTFQNKIVATADGKELDFAELEDDATIAIGDKATFDGTDAEGSFVMPEGETYVFVAGELTEIIPEEAEASADDKDAIIANLTEQLEALSNKAEDLALQNKAKDTVISNYKAMSKPAPANSGVKPTNSEAKKVSNATNAVAYLTNKNKK